MLSLRIFVVSLILPLQIESVAFIFAEKDFRKASYNETCDKLHLCWSSLVCVSERCECKPGKVYETNTEVCWDILEPDESTDKKGVSCFYDVQCQAGSWGPLSRCIKKTGKCECFDHQSKGRRDMVMLDDKCHVLKFVGDHCESHEECKKTVEGQVQCSEQSEKCECADGYIPNKSKNSCLPIAIKPEDKCEIDEQCQIGPYGALSKCSETGNCKCANGFEFRNDFKMCIENNPQTENVQEQVRFFAEKFGDRCGISYQCRAGALGNYSRCIRGQCQCYSPGGEETFYHPITHNCFLERRYNDSCHEDEECQASLGLQVKCGRPTGKYMETGKRCYCPFGIVCRSNAIGSTGGIHKCFQIYSFVSLLLAVFIA